MGFRAARTPIGAPPAPPDGSSWWPLAYEKYEAACRRCHTTTMATPSPGVSSKICPVNPRKGCIDCHMPARKVFEFQEAPTTMAEHRIAVFRELH